MIALRTKPQIGKADSSVHRPEPDDPWGCVWMPLFIIISYFVLSAIVRVSSNAGSKLDQFICYGALGVFVMMMIFGAIQNHKDGQAAAAKRQQWKHACKFADVVIASRYGSSGGSYEDEYGIPHTSRPRYHLDLLLNADQRAIAPNQTVVRVDVYSPVYEKLAKLNTVRIYYKPVTPLTFLLEEEL